MKAPATLALLLGASLVAFSSSCDSPYFDRNNPARIHRNAGIQAFKKERWAEAADEWKLSLQAKPNQPELYDKLAFAEARAGRLDDAAATMLKTVEFKTDEKEKLDVTRKVANMYLQNNKIDKAEEYFKKILEKAPNDDATMTWLGELHSILGGARSGAAPADLSHLEEAISFYDRALAISPEALTPTVNKRIALLKMRDHWQLKKNAADKDFEAVPKRDKKAKAEAKARQDEAQAKLDELTPRVDEASAKVTALLAKRKAAADGGTAGDDGGTPAGGETPGGDDAGTAGGGADAG
jgi:tetratricopeptide (TPR) repeat protein